MYPLPQPDRCIDHIDAGGLRFCEDGIRGRDFCLPVSIHDDGTATIYMILILYLAG
jgi:hypothetical protein